MHAEIDFDDEDMSPANRYHYKFPVREIPTLGHERGTNKFTYRILKKQMEEVLIEGVQPMIVEFAVEGRLLLIGNHNAIWRNI